MEGIPNPVELCVTGVQGDGGDWWQLINLSESRPCHGKHENAFDLSSFLENSSFGMMIDDDRWGPINTFNLVVVSGLRADRIIELARQRLSTIGMGFAVCVFTSLFIFPNWASDELHRSISSKFEKLGICIEGCLEEYFRLADEKENQTKGNLADCRAVLDSKSSDESLANFARWEPWHGKFGISYPWDKYLQIGDVLRELSATIISLKGCLQSPRQPSSTIRHSVMEPCETVGLYLAWTLGELGESIKKMERCPPKELVASKLQSMKLALSLIASPSKLGAVDNGEGLAMASFVFLLMEIVDKVEVLAKEVDELGELAGFRTKKP